MLEGIDVSNWQGKVDWGKVAASGRRFAFVKATEATYYRDSTFNRNWEQLAAHEMWRGAYHFGRPGLGPSGADEANYFCDKVLQTPQLGGDMYVLDLEAGPRGADLGAYVVDFAETVEARTGVVPILYTARSMITDWQLGTEAVARCPLWLAAWDEAAWPKPPLPWTEVAFWQYNVHAPVPGVPGPCDHDSFVSDEDALYAYGVSS